MAVKLRLMRMGKKKQPTYRVVAADSRSPRNGRFIEIVGVYDPRPDPSTVRIDNDKAVDWLRKGAQPTELGAQAAADLRRVGASSAASRQPPGCRRGRRRRAEAGRRQRRQGRRVTDTASPVEVPTARAVLEHLVGPWSRTPTRSASI